MRYSPAHKAQNHDTILSMAARSFRERGGDTSGIGTVMKKAGLTKGGFYRHFESKDDLFVQAVARAIDEMASGMLEVAQSVPEGQGLRAIIERYLSPRHANSPGMGCVFAALGPEFGRKPLSVLLFPSMAGVLTSVRVTSSLEEREQMLADARNFFIKNFAEA
jgi:TetR/AcrR family transcriptional repressor of nem operon